MKKVNFVVIFWLTIAIISFVAILISSNAIFSSIAYLIVPETGEYANQEYVVRSLITSIPMLVIEGIAFWQGIKLGMSAYRSGVIEAPTSETGE